MAENLVITALLSVIVFLLSMIAYFLKKHLEKFETLENIVANHEVRITVIEKINHQKQ